MPKKTATKPQTVKVGQTYESLDKRDNGRRLLVIEKLPDGRFLAVVTTTGRHVKIRGDRMDGRSGGYRLL